VLIDDSLKYSLIEVSPQFFRSLSDLGKRSENSAVRGQILLILQGNSSSFAKKAAERYGFKVQEYLTALDSEPRWSRQPVANRQGFLSKDGSDDSPAAALHKFGLRVPAPGTVRR